MDWRWAQFRIQIGHERGIFLRRIERGVLRRMISEKVRLT